MVNPGVHVPSILVPCILVIDDDEAIRLAVKALLLEEGYEVECAENGQAALEFLRTNCLDRTPSLIVLDLMMPVMDGLQFLEHQKRDDSLRHIPVVAFSANGSAQKPVLADAFIRKPLQIEPFLNLVQNYCLPALTNVSPS